MIDWFLSKNTDKKKIVLQEQPYEVQPNEKRTKTPTTSLSMV
jgi:hypothetical protein